MPWLCARTHPKKEKLVVDQLHHRAGLDVYAPQFRLMKKTKRGKQAMAQYLFPSYIFCQCDNPDEIQLVRYTTGVTKIIGRGPDPIEVPSSIIEDLQSTYPEDSIFEAADPALEPGARVEIVSGSLKSMKATVLAYLSVEDRLKILVEFLGRDTEVEIPTDHALAVSSTEDA